MARLSLHSLQCLARRPDSLHGVCVSFAKKRSTPGSDAPLGVSGSHRYADPGAYPVTVALTDDAGLSVSAFTTATVNDGPLEAAAVALQAAPGVALSGAPVSSFSDAHGFDAAAYSATIDWGDGSGGAGVVVGSGGHYWVTGDHTYAHPGNYTIRVVIDDVLSTAIVSADVRMGEAAKATPGQVLTVATFTDDDPHGVLSD